MSLKICVFFKILQHHDHIIEVVDMVFVIPDMKISATRQVVIGIPKKVWSIFSWNIGPDLQIPWSNLFHSPIQTEWSIDRGELHLIAFYQQLDVSFLDIQNSELSSPNYCVETLLHWWNRKVICLWHFVKIRLAIYPQIHILLLFLTTTIGIAHSLYSTFPEYLHPPLSEVPDVDFFDCIRKAVCFSWTQLGLLPSESNQSSMLSAAVYVVRRWS